MAPQQKSRLRFNGDGFDRDEFGPEERAKMRERSHHYDSHFLSSEEFLKEANLLWVSAAAKGFPAFIKAFAAISTVGGGYAVLKMLEVIQ